MALTGASLGFMVKFFSSTLFYESALSSNILFYYWLLKDLGNIPNIC